MVDLFGPKPSRPGESKDKWGQSLVSRRLRWISVSFVALRCCDVTHAFATGVGLQRVQRSYPSEGVFLFPWVQFSLPLSAVFSAGSPAEGPQYRRAGWKFLSLPALQVFVNSKTKPSFRHRGYDRDRSLGLRFNKLKTSRMQSDRL